MTREGINHVKSMRSIGVVLFEDFELLDVFGPLEMYGMAPESFYIQMVAQRKGAVASRQGPKSVAEYEFDDGLQFDILLIPGGRGTRTEVGNATLLQWLRAQSVDAEYVTSVCTGSALLARAGILDGVRATTNKRAFAWAASQGEKVEWQREARWVEDGKFFTSSGVSAGMDMSLAVIDKLLGRETAENIATWTEYEWHSDADWDPFAKIYGLV
jgi:transcriptional regulator GlxA family with amidase domain